MPPSSTTTLLSPAELSYLHTSLSLSPPVRPDGRSPTQFRPLVAETDILAGTNGSGRVCFADGTEAIVGIKGEVEKTVSKATIWRREREPLVSGGGGEDVEMGDDEEGPQESRKRSLGMKGRGNRSWVQLSIEIPGYRDDDALPVFLSSMLAEALVATGDLADKLYINTRFHWRLYIDIELISSALSYPMPLLSIATHLALLSTRLPLLLSEGDEDPLFSDDWAAALPLYPQSSSLTPPVTLLIVAVGDNVVFDPSKEEVMVADSLLAVSLAKAPIDSPNVGKGKGKASKSKDEQKAEEEGNLMCVGIRTVDPPSRTTTLGVPHGANEAEREKAAKEGEKVEGVWKPRRGGMLRSLVPKVISMCVGKGGVGEEVFAGLQAVKI